MPAIFLWSVVDLLKRFLTCCNYAFVPLVAMVIGSVLHMLWLWVFVTFFEMGANGVPMAMILTESLKLVIIYTYARCLPEMEKALFLPTMDVFSGWGQYLKLAIPTILMLGPEWWAFEFLIIMAGFIGVKEQAVIVISLSLLGILFMFPLGFSEAAAAVVGNSMGENEPDLAKKYIRVTAMIAVPTQLTFILLTYLLRSQISSLYFNPDSVEHPLLVSVISVMVIESIFDLSQGLLQGPLRALTLQFKASIICIVCNWVFGIPFCALFAFKFDMGIQGLWYGLIIALTLQFGAYLTILLTSDYEKIAEEVHASHTKALEKK
jgi:MATE family multidrug resistance protein